jgi:hypothetical protein
VAAALDAAKDVGLRRTLDQRMLQADALATNDPVMAARLRGQDRTAVLALLARDVYFDTSVPELLPRGWSRVTDAGELAGLRLAPASLSNVETGYFAAVYKDANTGGYVYANRGSDELKDFVHNVMQGAGQGSPQYAQAVRNATFIADSAQAANITFIGHSLGGGLASAQSYATEKPGVAFNAAGLHPSTLDPQGRERMSSNAMLVQSYQVRGEALTAAQGWWNNGLVGQRGNLPPAAGTHRLLEPNSGPAADSVRLHSMTSLLDSLLAPRQTPQPRP